jgi:hypothetical protein
MVNKILTIMLDVLFSYLLEFKTDKQRKEYYSNNVSLRLKNRVRILAFVTFVLFRKKTVVTEVFRTQHENDKIYGWKEGSKKKRKISVHSDWRGVDTRVADSEEKAKDAITYDEAMIIAAVMNGIPYDNNRPKVKTAKFGDAVHRNHIHLQIWIEGV